MNRLQENQISKVIIGSDHSGYNQKESLKSFIEHTYKLKIIDIGTYNSKRCDYVDIAHEGSKLLQEDTNARMILLCTTGTGMSIVANRYVGVRCVYGHKVIQVMMSREHNNANALAMGVQVLELSEMRAMVQSFLETCFNVTDEYGNISKHAKQIANIDKIIKDNKDNKIELQNSENIDSFLQDMSQNSSTKPVEKTDIFKPRGKSRRVLPNTNSNLKGQKEQVYKFKLDLNTKPFQARTHDKSTTQLENRLSSSKLNDDIDEYSHIKNNELLTEQPALSVMKINTINDDKIVPKHNFKSSKILVCEKDNLSMESEQYNTETSNKSQDIVQKLKSKSKMSELDNKKNLSLILLEKEKTETLAKLAKLKRSASDSTLSEHKNLETNLNKFTNENNKLIQNSYVSTNLDNIMVPFSSISNNVSNIQNVSAITTKKKIDQNMSSKRDINLNIMSSSNTNTSLNYPETINTNNTSFVQMEQYMSNCAAVVQLQENLMRSIVEMRTRIGLIHRDLTTEMSCAFNVDNTVNSTVSNNTTSVAETTTDEPVIE